MKSGAVFLSSVSSAATAGPKGSSGLGDSTIIGARDGVGERGGRNAGTESAVQALGLARCALFSLLAVWWNQLQSHFDGDHPVSVDQRLTVAA